MLAVEPKGWDKLWALKNRIEVPLDHVTNVREGAGESARGIRAPGTAVPGVIIAGTYYDNGKPIFWNVHDSRKAIAIDLRDERFARLVVEVADPAETINTIQKQMAAKAASA